MGEMRGVGWFRQGFEGGHKEDNGDGSVYPWEVLAPSPHWQVNRVILL